MTEQEEIKKEIRKAVREVFMKYKRENFWNSKGHYEYHKDFFHMAFSLKLHDRFFWNNYVSFNYKDGATIRLDSYLTSFLDLKEYKELCIKVALIRDEMDTAAALWRNFYKMKFGRNR